MALPPFFSMNGYNFEKQTDQDNNTDYIYLQTPHFSPTLIGIVSGTTIYFDSHLHYLLGDFDMDLWSETLNYAISDDININKNYEDQRIELQAALDEKSAIRTRAILESIHYTVYGNVEYDSDEETDEDLTDYEDFYDDDNDEFDEVGYVNNHTEIY
jgi:hypothetical protein